LYFFRDDAFLTKSFYNENDTEAIHFNDYDNYEYYAADLVKKELEELKSLKNLSNLKEYLKKSTVKESVETNNSILYDFQSDLSTNLSKLDAYSQNESLGKYDGDESNRNESAAGNFTNNTNYSSLLIRNQYSIQHTLDDDSKNRYNQHSLN